MRKKDSKKRKKEKKIGKPLPTLFLLEHVMKIKDPYLAVDDLTHFFFSFSITGNREENQMNCLKLYMKITRLEIGGLREQIQ